jgi:hypothetical protein
MSAHFPISFDFDFVFFRLLDFCSFFFGKQLWLGEPRKTRAFRAELSFSRVHRHLVGGLHRLDIDQNMCPSPAQRRVN